jgi:hypothetical protein
MIGMETLRSMVVLLAAEVAGNGLVMVPVDSMVFNLGFLIFLASLKKCLVEDSSPVDAVMRLPTSLGLT